MKAQVLIPSIGANEFGRAAEHLIKGGGGRLLQEKIVATASIKWS